MRGRKAALLGGPFLALVAGAAALGAGWEFEAAGTAAVTTLCAVWWVGEAIPIPVTSLLPFALFPLVGVLDHGEVATAYGHTLILLLMGGFLLSTAMEKSGAHRRLAFFMLRLVGGGGPKRLVLGFMLATAFCSMWISNTATVLMMLPVALAVLERDPDGRLGLPLMLGIAYAASIGGLGTPVGTPPNVIFLGIYKEETGVELGFLDWMKIGIPAVLVLLPLAFWWITRGLRGRGIARIPSLPAMRKAERRVLLVFALTACAWIFRTAPAGGWSAWLGVRGAGDSTVALLAVCAMFLVPSGERDGKALLDWETASRIPWGLLLLFGGGIAIARAFQASGLSASLGELLAGAAGGPFFLTLLSTCLFVTFLTEVTSNTATTTLLMPVLASAALAAGLEPQLLMIPACLSASCAFMLPVATAPNAIVFGAGGVRVREMAGAGFSLNLMGALVLALCCLALLPLGKS